MKNWQACTLSLFVAALGMATAGCSMAPTEHYVSPHIEGSANKINLDEVQKAFWDTKGKDFNSWMAEFEKRVNQIYDGKDVVSIDASRASGKLVVTGFVDKDGKEGFQPGDDKLFSIEQTGEAVNNEVPYRVANSEGRVYYEGHHSFLDSPIVQMMLFSHLMGGGFGGWGGRYYTPPSRVVVIHRDRESFRGTPDFARQQASNSSFFSRFKSNASSGQLESRRGFGSTSSFSSSDSSTKRRSWFGSSSSGSSSGSSGFSWGGRRSSGFGGGMRSGGWGRRR